MAAFRMFLHIRRGAGSEEIRSERGQQCDPNQTKRPGSFGSQREIYHVRMHAWQWRHVDSTVYLTEQLTTRRLIHAEDWKKHGK